MTRQRICANGLKPWHHAKSPTSTPCDFIRSLLGDCFGKDFYPQMQPQKPLYNKALLWPYCLGFPPSQ